MLYSAKPQLLIPLFFLLSSFLFGNLTLAYNLESISIKGRTLMSIKETPIGGNVTFDCSPSGPCIPCLRAEKNDEKYRCGETGYRIRLKCVPSGSGSKDSKSTKGHKKRSTLEFTELGDNQHDGDLNISSTRQRRLLGDSSKSGPRSYVTYRSCIPAVNEEKLSVLGFEALMLGLLVSSGSFIYFRRKRAAVPGGVPVRLPTSSRF
ncbi:uncharacterized protein LOC130993733 isoform X2 [Salvia miltiorrhiza]|uniref:uncharacterized protein LOC130993733 isoform X2 n=1 Tax=Salvia miltiorrhiza TaxID=226208 RepID=UPI0025AC9FF9|nr:uncharacterized protein LOC130993733 isoform X2 [Salvia miltiorrhiza]